MLLLYIHIVHSAIEIGNSPYSSPLRQLMNFSMCKTSQPYRVIEIWTNRLFHSYNLEIVILFYQRNLNFYLVTNMLRVQTVFLLVSISSIFLGSTAQTERLCPPNFSTQYEALCSLPSICDCDYFRGCSQCCLYNSTTNQCNYTSSNHFSVNDGGYSTSLWRRLLSIVRRFPLFLQKLRTILWVWRHYQPMRVLLYESQRLLVTGGRRTRPARYRHLPEY